MLNIPPITRNLLIINVICYLLQEVLKTQGIDLTQWLGLHFILADDFNIFQLVTYMFLHGSFTHLFSICFRFGCLAASLSARWASSVSSPISLCAASVPDFVRKCGKRPSTLFKACKL